jgi:hypothetical protein
MSLAAAGGSTTSATLSITGAGSSLTTAPLTNVTIGHGATGTATVNVTSGGTLNVGTGGSTFLYHTGTVNVSGGNFSAGTFINSGSLNITTGVVSADSLTQNSTSSLAIGISGLVRGSQYGTLLSSGAASLAGSLTVSLNSFSPPLGSYFDLLDSSSPSGTFSTIQLPPLAGTLSWNTDALYSSGVLSVIDTNYLPGDFDRGGLATVADVATMTAALSDLSEYKSMHSLTTAQLRSIGDLNGDGLVNNADLQGLLNIVASGGTSNIATGSPNTDVTAVPEPAAGMLLGLSLPIFLIAVIRRYAARTAPVRV